MKAFKTALLLCLALILFTLPFKAFATARVVKVAFSRNMRPYQYVDEGGVCVGMHIDMLERIGELKGLKMEYTEFSSNAACVNALRQGDVDVVLGAYSVDSDELLEIPMLSSGTLCLIASNAVSRELRKSSLYRKHSAAFEFGSIEYLYMSQIGANSYLALPSQEDVFRALISGEATFAIGVYECMTYMLDSAGVLGGYDVLKNNIATTENVILLQSSERELYKLLDSGLAELRTRGEYDDIRNAWIADRKLLKAQALSRQIFTVTAVILGAALFIILRNVRMNVVLKRKVEEKTSELRQANEALEAQMAQQRRESRLRNSIIENSPAAMIFFSSDHRVKLMNLSAMRLAGLNDMPDDGVSMRTLPVFGDILMKLDQRLTLYEGVHSEVIELGGADKRRFYRLNVYPIERLADFTGMLMAVEDVTHEERRKQEVFELEKNRSLNRLVAGIAHEIRNPLMSIRTAASLILTQGDDPEVQQAFGRFVPTEVDRINQLIEGLINYARPVKGSARKLNVSELIADALSLTGVAAKKHGLVIETELESGLFIYACKDQIKQSFINLIMNAIESVEKSMESRETAAPHLLIRTYGDEEANILIRDSGVGMDENELMQCTEPFFTTKAKGTGLGMALAKQFIQDNGGRLSVESEKGRYTQVLITFGRCL